MPSFKSDLGPFRSKLSETTFIQKYQHLGCESWADLASVIVNDVCRNNISEYEKQTLTKAIAEMKFIPGGRYLYYAGRPKKFFNNCYLLKAEEDTREDWADLSWKSESCLLTGGGIGCDYSAYRPSGVTVKRTGGKASGPIPKMFMINEIGRNVIQGGSRRSAIYASLNWKHGDIDKFLKVKDWHNSFIPGTNISYAEVKHKDFNFSAPLDMTNISVNYDTEWLLNYWKTSNSGEVFKKNVYYAALNGEPGFSFNFFDKENETLRNACTEVVSEDDSDVCNLGSLNISRIHDIKEFYELVGLSVKFLLCGTLIADLPYEKIYKIREKNRRLGLGLMGLHEWLLQRKYNYEVVPELHNWLTIYRSESDKIAKEFSNELSISRPVAVRSIAPTGTIGMVAGTTTGIEPIFATAYKRRYITDGTKYKYQYHIDFIAQQMIELYDINPNDIETAHDLNFEKRIKFQADIQDYVDMSISSTINIPKFDESKLDHFIKVILNYAHRLRGLTFYPDGSRGGQPITKVSYEEAKEKLGEEFEDNLESNESCSICSV